MPITTNPFGAPDDEDENALSLGGGMPAPGMPAAPGGVDPNLGIDPTVMRYLQMKQQEEDEQRRQMSAARVQNMQDAGMAGVARGLAQTGQVFGKAPSAEPYVDTLKQIGAERTALAKETMPTGGLNSKVAEYLMKKKMREKPVTDDLTNQMNAAGNYLTKSGKDSGVKAYQKPEKAAADEITGYVSDKGTYLTKSGKDSGIIAGNKTGEKSTKPLAPQMITDVNDAVAAHDTVTKLDKLITDVSDEMGPVSGRFKSPWNKRAQSANADLSQAAQVIGKYLEGGKMTDADVERYKDEQLPTLADTPEVAKHKIESLKAKIRDKHNRNVKTFASQNYDIAGIEEIPEIPGIPLNTERGGTATAAPGKAVAPGAAKRVRVKDPTTGQTGMMDADDPDLVNYEVIK